MNLEKQNIKQVAGSKFYISKKRPDNISYKEPLNLNDWKEINLDYIYDMKEPEDDEILYYYNEIKGTTIKLKDLV
jgi:hypothetical protein